MGKRHEAAMHKRRAAILLTLSHICYAAANNSVVWQCKEKPYLIKELNKRGSWLYFTHFLRRFGACCIQSCMCGRGKYFIDIKLEMFSYSQFGPQGSYTNDPPSPTGERYEKHTFTEKLQTRVL